MPNVPNGNGFNYRASTIAASAGYQYDVKIDHHFNENMHLSGRYSHLYSDFSTPFIVGDGTDANGNTINDGLAGKTVVNNAGLEFNWTLTPTTLWTSRFALDRVNSPGQSVGPRLCLCRSAGNSWTGQRLDANADDSDGYKRSCEPVVVVQSVLHGYSFRAHSVFVFFRGFVCARTAHSENWI